jgi:phenylalanyl-tRNA synthetase beta chain
MPVINIELDDLNRMLKEPLNSEEFSKIIPQIGADPDEINEKDAVIEFFPDRPDLLSTEGVARAIRAFTEQQLGLIDYNTNAPTTHMVVSPSVLDIRPHVLGGIVRGIKLDNTSIKCLMELQEKLHVTLGRKRNKVSIGIHDLDKLVAPFNYTTCSPHEPAFVPLQKDYEMTPEEILKEHPKGIEYAHLLENFDEYPLITDSKGEVASLPPIINGALTTITENTSDVLIDVTGLDQKAVEACLNIVAAALVERGGEIEQLEIKYPSEKIIAPQMEPKNHKINNDYLIGLLGSDPENFAIFKAFRKCGMEPDLKDETWHVKVPAYRADILHPIDLLEEVAIGLGYDNLPEQLPKEARFGDALKSRKLENRCRETMLGIGFQEVVTLTLTSTDMLHNSTGRESDNEATVSNPVTEDYHMLRSSILPNLIELLKNNRHRELPQKIFEVGQVVREHSNHISLSWIELASKATFSTARSTAEIISQRLNLKGDLNDEEDPLFIPGRCVQIKSDNFTLKYGEIHPRTLEKFELVYPAIGGEIIW